MLDKMLENISAQDINRANLMLGIIIVGLLILLFFVILQFFVKFSSLIKKLLTIALLILFSFYIIFTTNTILQRNYNGDFITASLDYYIDVINIFQALLFDFEGD